MPNTADMKTDVVVIGAGVVGLAVAGEIAPCFNDVFVLDQHASFGRETSSRSSEVIHAGIYYPENSLKARLCIDGRQRLYAFCLEKGIPHQRCGKLIVATAEEEKAPLTALFERARANGVRDLIPFSSKQIRENEPNIKAAAALFSPSTGIIDSHRLMALLETRAANAGAVFVYQTRVEGVEMIAPHHYRLRIVNPDGGKSIFDTQFLINCAGLQADVIAAGLGFDLDAHGYRQYFWKGEYFTVHAPAHHIRRLVYPVPLPAHVGLGVHATIDLNGQIRLGPNSKYLPDRRMDYSVDPSENIAFFDSARRFLSFLRLADLAPDTAGIRPTLQQPGEPRRDFVIREETGNGFPGLVNLIGMDSPALTSCLSIARYVKKLLE